MEGYFIKGKLIPILIVFAVLCMTAFGQTTANYQSKYNEAIKAFDKAIEINPQYAEAWHSKGNALKALGRTSESDAAFATANELGYAELPY